MTHWNHRVVKKDGCLGIHEVYYDKNGEPEMCTEEPIRISTSDTEEGVKDLKWILDHMITALEHPILDYEDF